MKNKIRIVVLDDHTLFVDGLVSIYRNDDTISIDHVFYSSQHFINSLPSLSFDILLLDLKMPQIDGIQVLHFLTKRNVKMNFKVIVLTTFSDAETIRLCRELGVSAFFLKITGQDQLRDAILRVNAQQQDFICDSQISLSQMDVFSYWNFNYKISKREWQIIQLLMQNFSSQEISEHLNISSFTVDTHRKNILYKLSVKNTIGIIHKISAES